MRGRILFVLAVVAFLFPTTLNGIVTNTYLLIFATLLEIVFISLILFGKLKINKIQGMYSLAILLILLIATLFTLLSGIKIGSFMYYLSYITISSIDFKNSEYSKTNNINAYRFFSILVILLGLCMILNIPIINNIEYKFYGAYYQELIPLMQMGSKPVLTFSTHSVSGFAMFLFFCMSFFTYKKFHMKIDLFLSFGFCFLIVNLKSFTAIMYFVIAIGMIFTLLSRKTVIRICVFIGLVIIYMLIFQKSAVNEMSTMIHYILFEKQNNGLTGRYAKGGAMTKNLSFIKDNLFRPVGFGFDDRLSFVDSGIIEYLLRGSILLVISMYLGFFTFLKNNIDSKLILIILFSAFITFETGFAVLILTKIIFFIPFMITYFEYLSNTNKKLE